MRPRFVRRPWWSLFLSFSFGLSVASVAAKPPTSVWLGYEFGGDIPLTAQTAGKGIYGYGANPIASTVLLPIGTVLDPLVTTYACVYSSVEDIANALSTGEQKIVRAQDDAAMHVATAGEYRSARLEAAFEHLRGFWYFEHFDSQQMATFILAVSSPGGNALGR